MRRTVVSMIFLVLLILLCSCEKTPAAVDGTLIGDQISDEEYSLLRDQDLYRFAKDGPEDFLLTDQPILRYFPFLYPQQMAQSPAAFLNDDALWKHQYLVFDNHPILMKLSTTEPVGILISYADSSLPFIRDLLDVRKEMTILDTCCTVQNVVLSNSCDPAPTNGVLLYYETDQGIFVRYYRFESSSGEWFTLQRFTEFAQQYVQYLHDSSYNEDGEVLSGQMAFRDYLDAIRT